MKKIFSVIVLLLPWKLRRLLLIKVWKYEIHPTARIGFSYVYPRKLIMKAGSNIANLTVAVHLDKIEIGENSKIGRGNWITGFPISSGSKHFSHQLDRKSELIIGNESAITKKHHIDCTNVLKIGNFVTVAGYSTQFLTHSINIQEGRQDSSPITIGDYCFIGTNSVILGGASLPSYSVLGANSLLNKDYSEQYMLYGGVPAKPIKAIDKEAKYFTRTTGFIY